MEFSSISNPCESIPLDRRIFPWPWSVAMVFTVQLVLHTVATEIHSQFADIAMEDINQNISYLMATKWEGGILWLYNSYTQYIFVLLSTNNTSIIYGHCSEHKYSTK